MTTALEVRDSARIAKEDEIKPGCFVLDPPVQLIYKANDNIVHAEKVCIDGLLPDYLYILEWNGWVPAYAFEVRRQMIWACPVKECEGHKDAHFCGGFCRRCGAALEQRPQVAKAVNMLCKNKNCEARVIMPGDKFCMACGEPVTGSA